MQALALHATLHGNLTEALIYLGTLLEFNDEQHVEVTSILLRKLLEHHQIPLPAYMQSSSPPPTNKAKTTNIEINTTVYSMQDPASQKIIIAKETIQSSSSDPDEDMAKKYANLMQPLPIHIPTMNTDDIALALDREFPWMANITAHLLPSVRRHQRYALKGPLLGPVILVGAPGSGKTSYLRRLAELLGTKCTVISLAGMDNNMLLKGAARTWNRAEPSQIVRLINESGQANPMVILDEIEKASKESRNGNVYDALLQLIDTKDSEVYFDQYLAVPVDLSRVSYLATANSTQDLHSALKSRINVLQVTGPTKADFLSVAQAKWFRYFSNIGLGHSIPPFNAELFRGLLNQAKDLRDVGRMFDAALKSELEDIPLLRTH